jgi:hypothetical protein
LDPTPNSSDFLLFPATGAWEVFRKLFGDGNLLQMPCAHSHQQLDPNRTASVYCALLNVTALLGGKALPLDDSACEILAAALQVHFFCMMVQDSADWGAIKADQNTVFCEWLKDNPTPPEFVGTSVAQSSGIRSSVAIEQNSARKRSDKKPAKKDHW